MLPKFRRYICKEYSFTEIFTRVDFGNQLTIVWATSVRIEYTVKWTGTVENI